MIWIILGLLCFVIAISLLKFKLYFLIPGYNRLTVEQKEEQHEEQNIRPLAIYYAVMASIIGIFFFSMAILSYYNLNTVVSIILIMIVVMLVGGVMDSQRYLKTLTDEHSKPTKFTAYKYKQLIGYLCGVGIIVALIIYFAFKPISITLFDETLEVTGRYGDSYPFVMMEQLELLKQTPQIVETINGTTSNGQRQGLFKLQTGEEVTVYTNDQVNAVISFIFDGTRVFLNIDSEEETKALYEELLNK